jgi:thiamine pyrophosphate-dependent acetolactate synthase large subunit-like protein
MLLVVLSNRRYATLNAAATRLADGAMEAFTLEPPVLDFSGLATLHGWAFVRARNGEELSRALQALGPRVERNTLLELELDPAILPVTAARHF